MFTVGDKIISTVAIAWEIPKPTTGEIVEVLPPGDNPDCVETFYKVKWPGGILRESDSTLSRFAVVNN